MSSKKNHTKDRLQKKSGCNLELSIYFVLTYSFSKLQVFKLIIIMPLETMLWISHYSESLHIAHIVRKHFPEQQNIAAGIEITHISRIWQTSKFMETIILKLKGNNTLQKRDFGVKENPNDDSLCNSSYAVLHLCCIIHKVNISLHLK